MSPLPHSSWPAPWAAGLALALLTASCSESTSVAEPSTDGATPPATEGPPEFMRGFMSPAEFEALTGERGVTFRAAGVFEGYTLVMPLNSTQVHLLDLDGEVFHTWETGLSPGGWCYLQDDGTLLHAGRQDESPHFRGGGIGGIIQRFAPDGEVLWRYDFADEQRCQHHDIEPLPNGNLLFIAWERHGAAEAIARGRDPEEVGAAGLWSDALFEVRPTPPLGGEIVWSWHAWDHLVQDLDPALPNHGALADHPHRIDINGGVEPVDPDAAADRDQAMAALGYGGGTAPPPPPPGGDDAEGGDEEEEKNPWDESGDWTHTNAVDYHPVHDLIVMSSPELCEIFVVDHSTTRAEAASGSGGRRGRGGDLLWRWGNPAGYGMGTASDQKLYYQHDPGWLVDAPDLRLLVFNNGGKRPDGDYSAVLELVLPFDPALGFVREDDEPFGPRTAAWAYSAPDSFFSAFISGASRLPNGNTLICSGAPGRIFEVTPSREIVWDYSNDLGGDVEPPDHAGKAPPFALYRAARYAPEHPGIVALK